ncbi:aminopeptidase [Pseudomonas sp.]|uniref:aminopeptidase n=1 Tax=Pseudomonas sp. TaxID=306 RepID=UPI00257F4931|nr:aminopeptidase [Pseudomonas sp.]
MPKFISPLLDRLSLRWVPLLGALALSGCSSVDYYSQLLGGQYALLSSREPVAEIVANPAQNPQLRKRLALSQQARDFASSALALPDNNSYRLYADIKRPFVVWNVFATPEFSLEPELYCFPIAGCVAYRGFYDQNRARGAKALLQLQGLDTYMGGVEAYSTLGWFDDPILNTMLRWSDQRLVAVIFHELAHQKLYVPGDTAFNESFATFVEQQGWRQWHQAHPDSAAQAPKQQVLKQRAEFTELVLASRERLKTLYASGQTPEQMRAGKQAEFEQLRRNYRALRDSQWGGTGAYDSWIEAPMNNAKLLPFGLYDQWVTAFAVLFEQANGDWTKFYAQAAKIGALKPDERKARLEQLQQAAAPQSAQNTEEPQL